MNQMTDGPVELRVVQGESQEEIAAEIAKCAAAGKFVGYFPDQETLNRWRLRREVHV